MPKNFVRKTFDRWLAHSAGRFHHPPRVVVSRRDYVVLQFAGVTPAIECVIKKKGTVGVYRFQGEESSRLVFMRQVYEVDVGIYLMYHGQTWDMLPDFNVYQRRTPTGQYYCDACTPPERFPSRAALWVAHSFEPPPGLGQRPLAGFAVALPVWFAGGLDLGGTHARGRRARAEVPKGFGVCLSRGAWDARPSMVVKATGMVNIWDSTTASADAVGC
jgi:hypothetical protein